MRYSNTVYMYIHMCGPCIIRTTSIHNIYLNVCTYTTAYTYTRVCVHTYLNMCVFYARVHRCYTFMCPCVCERMHILRLRSVCVLVRLGAGVWLLGGGAQQGSAVLCASAASRDPVLTDAESPVGTAAYALPPACLVDARGRLTLGGAGRQMQCLRQQVMGPGQGSPFSWLLRGALGPQSPAMSQAELAG